MLSKKLQQYLNEANQNKAKMAKHRGFKTIQNGQSYPALISNVRFDEEKEEIIVEFLVFVSASEVRRERKFKTSGNARYFYDDLCNTLGTDGDPSQLLGRAMVLHFEQNGDFQNVRADARISMEELDEAIARMGADAECYNEERQVKSYRSGKLSKSALQEDIAAMEYDDDVDIEYDDVAVEVTPKKKPRLRTIINNKSKLWKHTPQNQADTEWNGDDYNEYAEFLADSALHNDDDFPDFV